MGSEIRPAATAGCQADEAEKGVRSRGTSLRPQGSLRCYPQEGDHRRLSGRGGPGSNFGLTGRLWLWRGE